MKGYGDTEERCASVCEYEEISMQAAVAIGHGAFKTPVTSPSRHEPDAARTEWRFRAAMGSWTCESDVAAERHGKLMQRH